MKKNSEIEKLKKEARRHYLAYYKIVDNFDFGLSLAEYISSDMVYHKNEFNRIMDELKELDPSTPTSRL